ncbi:EthD family reductase [Pseudoponticoccus marisrubri]|uniref:Ethyl tert-butyl ether degradation protein EthD n=1 Tax=Pseudoponticoccus marisrubri TaxID=1685382 RepID=A0A0W7WJ63_9RHOB|nr:EthD family reductase [Pseudoponticoccus marisrubri]KUF10520.1 ethyl tert-butyl ether degradation protein EthD [Pseudoponticoccus marisrubri]
MSASVQVLYPASDGSTFDHDYYVGTHMKMVQEAWGDLMQQIVVTKGVAGGPETPPGYHAVATMVFPDEAAMQAALGKAGPLLKDIPNFTDTTPQMLIGEVVG